MLEKKLAILYTIVFVENVARNARHMLIGSFIRQSATERSCRKKSKKMMCLCKNYRNSKRTAMKKLLLLLFIMPAWSIASEPRRIIKWNHHAPTQSGVIAYKRADGKRSIWNKEIANDPGLYDTARACCLTSEDHDSLDKFMEASGHKVIKRRKFFCLCMGRD